MKPVLDADTLDEEVDLDSAFIWAIRYLDLDAVEEMLSEGERSYGRTLARAPKRPALRKGYSEPLERRHDPTRI